MKWVFRGDRPIYAQIVEQIQRGVLNGEFPPGSGMPSVRALALDAGVNPNTMQKALSELETQGLLHTQRTAGRTVTEDKNMIIQLKEDLAIEHIRVFLEGMESLGIGKQETLRLLETAILAVPESVGAGADAGTEVN